MLKGPRRASRVPGSGKLPDLVMGGPRRPSWRTPPRSADADPPVPGARSSPPWTLSGQPPFQSLLGIACPSAQLTSFNDFLVCYGLPGDQAPVRFISQLGV